MMKFLFAPPLRNLTFAVLYMMVVFAAAVLGYVAVGWSAGDALYMVVLTIYTVGFDEVRPVDTPLLREITIATIVLGCTGMIFLTGSLVQFITINQLEQVLGPKRMQSQIDKLNAHVIVCGFGRIGQMLSQDLKAAATRFVIVERNEHRVEQARAQGLLCLQGEATDEAILKLAGVERARALATVLPDDAANVFITLSARSLNKSMEIIARGEAPSTESKLIYAGANKVVLPAHIGAERIAEIILYGETPRIVPGSAATHDFEETLESLGLRIATVAVDTPDLAGLTLDALGDRWGPARFVVQLNRRNGEAILQPAGSLPVERGDTLVLLERQAPS
jgi:voltage-gated potassium channel Kch